jgi:eukaryotic-like serine/threonine-protein kinase
MPFPAPEGTELVEPLGNGSVFDVAVVRDAADAILVCKRLTSRARGEQAGRAAIVREARFLALARHAALPRLVRIGSDAYGPFVLETRVEGRCLREVTARWRDVGQAVPRRLVAHVAALAAEALAELHELGDGAGPLCAVHGDVTPDHVILGPCGEIRLVDFGAARFRDMDASLTTGDRGTLPYAAPEVARGDRPPDAAADVYALAATVVHFATAQPLTGAIGEPAMLLEIGEGGLRRREALLAAVAMEDPGRQGLRAALSPDAGDRPTARALFEALSRA